MVMKYVRTELFIDNCRIIIKFVFGKENLILVHGNNIDFDLYVSIPITADTFKYEGHKGTVISRSSKINDLAIPVKSFLVAYRNLFPFVGESL